MTTTLPTADGRIDQLENFLRQDPDNATLMADAVQASLQAGQPARARALMALAGPALAGNAVMRHLDATTLLSEQRYPEAQALLRDLLASGVDTGAVRFNLGYASLRAGDPAAAAEILAPLMARDDAPDAALAYLLRSLHHAGHAEQAAAAWDAAPGRFRTPEAAAVASLAFLDLERNDEARALSDQALAAGTRSAEAYVARATLAVGDAEPGEAIALLERARQFAPEDGRVLSAVGAAELGRGNVPQAEAAFRRSVAALPQHVGAWHALAWCQIILGQLDAARASFDAALALDRNFGETHGGLAVVDMLQGHAEAAHAAIERAERLDRTGLSARYARALESGMTRDPQAMRAMVVDLLQRRAGVAGGKLLDRLVQK
jgi:Tfp pilus assembly protein PilF